jgi:hypothetical protein
VNPALSLCEHLRSFELRALPIESSDVLEWFDGPVVAVVRCQRCARAGLVAMLDWNASHGVRVFGLAAFELEVLAVFLRNTRNGSCDVSRLGRERHALLSSAGPAERLVAIDVAANEVRAVAPYPREGGLPTEALEERLPPEDDDQWFELAGLSKSGGR